MHRSGYSGQFPAQGLPKQRHNVYLSVDRDGNLTGLSRMERKGKERKENKAAWPYICSHFIQTKKEASGYQIYLRIIHYLCHQTMAFTEVGHSKSPGITQVLSSPTLTLNYVQHSSYLYVGISTIKKADTYWTNIPESIWDKPLANAYMHGYN